MSNRVRESLFKEMQYIFADLINCLEILLLARSLNPGHSGEAVKTHLAFNTLIFFHMGTNNNTREDLRHIRIGTLGTRNKGGFPLEPNVAGKGLDEK